ncbi:hypothetical protein TcG_11124 [Trypanosoma cruzi]|nr:hypothetical protein TcG_11124 [Trypanosoma cruzi]
MQALRVFVQVPCNSVATNMLRLGDAHIVVVLTNSRGTAHTDALSGRSGASLRRCREQDVLTQPRRAWSVTMAQSAVAGGIFTSRRQQRERERELLLLLPLLASLLPFVASHADYSVR